MIGASGSGVAASALRAAARRADPLVREVFEDLHRHPEIGLEVPRTVAAVRAALEGLPLEVHEGSRIGSLVAVLGRGRPGAVTVLRADVDALPLRESDEHALRSQHDGVMHACGHDMHAAMLVGAAHVLSGLVESLPGPVVFVWQPGEEGYDGMGAMIGEGLLELIEGVGPAGRSYGLHVLSDPALTPGVFTGRAGVTHAATASFDIVITGRGGHGAFPHQAKDPIPVAAELVSALYTARSRELDPFAPAVVTVGTVHAGTAQNVIAETATISGTVRSYSDAVGAQLYALIARVAEGVAAAHGVRAEVTITEEYPVVRNDADAVEALREVVGTVLGDERFERMTNPLPAGDDYGRLLARIPGAYFMLIAGLGDEHGQVHPNHSPHVRFDPGLLADGVAVLAGAALGGALTS